MSKELTAEEQENLLNDILDERSQLGGIFEQYGLSNQLAVQAIALLVALTLTPPKGTESLFIRDFNNYLVQALKSLDNEMSIPKVIVINGKK